MPDQAVYHLPVLFHEVMNWMRTEKGGVYLDCTLGGGGHTQGIFQACGGQTEVYGIDRDRDAIAAASERLKAYPGFHAIHGNFHAMAAMNLPQLDGVLIDLGVSSHQLDTPERGFSYHEDAPLDMRMDASQPLTAAKYLENRIRQRTDPRTAPIRRGEVGRRESRRCWMKNVGKSRSVPRWT